MRLKINDERLQTLEQIEKFIEGSQLVTYQGINSREKYIWIEEVLRRFRYQNLERGEKAYSKVYFKSNGLLASSLTRLISVYLQSGHIQQAKYQRYRFLQRYSAVDVALLAKTDELHGWLSGPATKRSWSVNMRHMVTMNMPILPEYL